MPEPRHITSIEPTARDAYRATVHVNAKRIATLSLKLIADMDLHVGQAWDAALSAQVKAAGTYDKAMRQAMNRLGRRAMSRRELDRKLAELEYDEAVRQRVLDRLGELKYLDDEAFGRALIRELMRSKPAGPFLLRQKLAQRGLDRTLAERLVSESINATDQVEQAASLAQRRLRQLQRLDPMTRKRRVWSLLARRGFDSDTIESALRRVEADGMSDVEV